MKKILAAIALSLMLVLGFSLGNNHQVSAAPYGG